MQLKLQVGLTGGSTILEGGGGEGKLKLGLYSF